MRRCRPRRCAASPAERRPLVQRIVRTKAAGLLGIDAARSRPTAHPRTRPRLAHGRRTAKLDREPDRCRPADLRLIRSAGSNRWRHDLQGAGRGRRGRGSGGRRAGGGRDRVSHVGRPARAVVRLPPRPAEHPVQRLPADPGPLAARRRRPAPHDGSRRGPASGLRTTFSDDKAHLLQLVPGVPPSSPSPTLPAWTRSTSGT